MKKAIMSCANVKKYYPVGKHFFKYVVGQKKIIDDVSFVIEEGETIALVGESGCGKTVLLRLLLNIEKETEGTICYKYHQFSNMPAQLMKEYKSSVQMIFQDTLSSLHPRLSILDSLEEPLKLIGMKNKEERLARIQETLSLVGLDAMFLERYPHQLSGGQRQRVVIARALLVKPKLIFADEPISALDVSLQAQIINLLMDLQEELNLSIFLVAHDLAVVRQIAKKIMIMYLGNIVESGESQHIYKDARHPYTKVLLKAAPSISKGIKQEGFHLELKEGDAPDPANPPSGCPFCTRCVYADEVCESTRPGMLEVSPGHFVRCHKAGALT